MDFNSKYIDLAKHSNHPKHKHATIIFYKGEVVSYGNNKKGGHHAEVAAIIASKLKLSVKKWPHYAPDLYLLSIAITKDGKLKLAKPCKVCRHKIKLAGIKHVYYTTKKQNIERLK